MEAKLVKGLSLKALVDVEKNRVVFVESEDDLIDILLSFLTMPIGSIIRLIRDQPPVVGIGCMDNLYESVENLDVQFFRTEACKSMLLQPRNGAAAQCASLKLTIDDSEPLQYFCCESEKCTISQHKLLSHYRNAICGCGRLMSRKFDLTENKQLLLDARNRGVFVKGLARMIVSDELKIMPPGTATSFSLLSNLGLTDGSTIEERVFKIGVDQDPDFERFLKSDDHKAMLISPKVAPGFKLGNQPLGVEEYKHQQHFYYSYHIGYSYAAKLTCQETLLPSSESDSFRRTLLSVMDPKLHYMDNATSSGGFVIESTMFKVTDNLIITPISPMSGLTVLSKLKVPFSDIEERVVHVGKEEASRLLVASFVTKSALTNAFIQKYPKQE
ncbi:hypothetical protein COLO4_19074 [Corchorus olitorius]|uniref:DUF674 family protein n=1 Tax=Corchorus olitorius TaxID=93759 RepID=A0A1R3J6X9_9ROSI|nr:hypothetical protein COLO4_19074 [Corchorus olitorius]